MHDLSLRARDSELLDQGVSDEELRKSLADLRFVNRWLGNSDRLIRTVLSFLEGSRSPKVLDVGCGSADLLERIRRRFPGPLEAVGLDIKGKHLQLAPPTVRAVVGDVRRLPFAAESFDVVMASQFLHHFDGAEVAEILTGLYSLTRGALVVSDLRRARVPYLFGRVAFPLLFTSRVSVNDGLISIRRGFRRAELARAFHDARIPARIEHCWPYRLLAVANKDRFGLGPV
jgi:hypothetical protein